MPVITNITDFSFSYYFIFSENDILVTECNSFITKEMLPPKQTVLKFLKAQTATDWFAEREYDYCAVMLEKDTPISPECNFIPLREFFWNTKTQEQKDNFIPSELGTLAARAHGFLRLRQNYIYCPKCGEPMVLDTKETAKVCPKCGRLDFPHIEPATITLITKGDEILLVKNRRSPQFFGLVSGFVEMGETLEQCVAREVKEETNLEIQNIRYAGSQAWPFPDQLMLAFTAEYKSGELKIQESELLDGGWFKKDDLPVIPRPGSVAYNLIMKEIQRQR